ncbi:hypothetical protein M5K25_022373 [Dendrobium thyrsiflorum]|uniref:Nuclear cap-binding protein subunit 2 n=1 Tax=Dendrobium thyrsiflorum TaxID=117978 RepID=A0ABD0UCI9_DENTH
MEILEGEERMPLLKSIPREKTGRGYGEKREGIGYERRVAEFEQREVDYDQRGAKFERRRDFDEGFGYDRRDDRDTWEDHPPGYDAQTPTR